MKWLTGLIATLLKNNGTGTGAGEADSGDIWDAVQTALIAASAIGAEALLKHLEYVSQDSTGAVAAILTVVVFVLKAGLNALMDNKKT